MGHEECDSDCECPCAHNDAEGTLLLLVAGGFTLFISVAEEYGVTVRRFAANPWESTATVISQGFHQILQQGVFETLPVWASVLVAVLILRMALSVLSSGPRRR